MNPTLAVTFQMPLGHLIKEKCYESITPLQN